MKNIFSKISSFGTEDIHAKFYASFKFTNKIRGGYSGNLIFLVLERLAERDILVYDDADNEMKRKKVKKKEKVKMMTRDR